MFTVPSLRATQDTREKLSMSELVTTYKCADGTDFPVAWQHEGDASLSWGLNEQHWSGPLRPLDAAVWEEHQRAGAHSRRPDFLLRVGSSGSSCLMGLFMLRAPS